MATNNKDLAALRELAATNHLEQPTEQGAETFSSVYNNNTKVVDSARQTAHFLGHIQDASRTSPVPKFTKVH